MAAPECTENAIWRRYMLPVIFGFAELSIIVATGFFIHARVQKKLKSQTSQFYLAITFYVAIFVNLLANMMFYIEWCIGDADSASVHILLSLTAYLHPVQSVMLCIILFLRLVSIFKDTIFAVSRDLIIGFVIYVTVSLLFCFAGFGVAFSGCKPCITIGLLLIGVAVVMYIGAILTLNGIFVHKLRKIYNAAAADAVNKEKNERFVNIITRTTVLTIVSTSFILLYNILLFLMGSVHSPVYTVLHDIVFIADLYTNFLSVYWSFAYYHRWYVVFCGLCHRSCFTCCNAAGRRRSHHGEMVSGDIETEMAIESKPTEMTFQTSESPRSVEQMTIT